MWGKFASIILRNRLYILAIIALLTVFFGYFAFTSLKVDNRVGNTLPKDSPVQKDFEKFKLEFGEDGSTIVVAIQTDSLYTKRNFTKWRELSYKILKYDGVENVISEATLWGLKNNLKEQQFAMRTKELEKQIEEQKKLVEEMRRKQEQGSMQLQGEVQELMLEELLQTTFPFDKIEEVGKGVRGADCIQVVRNQFGNESGKIIYESKRTKDFANDWIEKLKSDMRTLGADVAIIVTQTLPKDMDRFGEKDGVYICTFTEVRSVALLLRNALLKIAEAKKVGIFCCAACFK